RRLPGLAKGARSSSPLASERLVTALLPPVRNELALGRRLALARRVRLLGLRNRHVPVALRVRGRRPTEQRSRGGDVPVAIPLLLLGRRRVPLRRPLVAAGCLLRGARPLTTAARSEHELLLVGRLALGRRVRLLRLRQGDVAVALGVGGRGAAA